MLNRFLKPLDHAVQRQREPLDLIAGVHDGKPFADIFRADALGLLRDRSDRIEQIAHEDQPAEYRDEDENRYAESQSQPDRSEFASNGLIGRAGLDQEAVAFWHNISESLQKDPMIVTAYHARWIPMF